MTFEKLLKSKGWSQYSLAVKMNKTHTTTYRWCKGVNEPSCSDIVKLSKVLDVSVEDIVLMFAAKGGEDIG